MHYAYAWRWPTPIDPLTESPTHISAYCTVGHAMLDAALIQESFLVPFRSFRWLLLIPALLAAGCDSTADPDVESTTATDVRTVEAATAVAVERPISRFVAVSGTLSAQ